MAAPNPMFNPWAKEHAFQHVIHMAFGLSVLVAFHFLLMLLLVEAGKQKKSDAAGQTNWLGCMVVGDVSHAWQIPNVVLGVKSDGSVIWKQPTVSTNAQ